MRDACKKMRRCSISCNIQLQKDSCLPAKTQGQSSDQTCPAGEQQNSPLTPPGKPDPLRHSSVVSRLSLKVMMSAKLGRAPCLPFPSPLSCQLLQGTTLSTGGEEKHLGSHDCHQLLRGLSWLPPATKSFPVRRSRHSGPLFPLAHA